MFAQHAPNTTKVLARFLQRTLALGEHPAKAEERRPAVFAIALGRWAEVRRLRDLGSCVENGQTCFWMFPHGLRTKLVHKSLLF